MSDVEHLFKGLNKEQKSSVVYDGGSLAVLAGAGSGKTKVLTHRIAYLMKKNGWAPQNIMAVTFTNKAAQEMKKRLIGLNIGNVDNMWVGTFHGLAYKFLRLHHEAAALSKSFQILDAQDQEKVMKKLFKANDWSEKIASPKDAIYFINNQKDQGYRPLDLQKKSGVDQRLLEVYGVYQDHCDKNNLVDFGELILRAYETLEKNNDILLSYQTLFNHILVDEFQDTNEIQYKWIDLLSASGAAVPATIVGDTDQSIYSWRGAQMKNVERFVDGFVSTSLIKLEQNYRSTHHILSCANHLIKNNRDRLDKTLWTKDASGDVVSLFEAYDEREEADWVVAQIIKAKGNLGRWDQAAVLYRSNAQSRLIEEACIKKGVPYKIHGGLKFFDRQEIKDVLSHMHVILNPRNDLMLERALSAPSKGFGPKAFDALRTASVREEKYWGDLLNDEQFAKAALTSKAKTAWLLWRDLWSSQSITDLGEVARFCVEKTLLLSHYQDIDRKEGSDRAENLKEFVSVAKRYQESYRGPKEDVLGEFLASVAMEGDHENKSDDAVQLMTIHASKGLEFPAVFLIGWDDGIFPSSQSQSDPERLSEERRLAYVAMTRAEKILFITGAATRYLYGQKLELAPSRFYAELPSSSVSWRRPPVRKHKVSHQTEQPSLRASLGQGKAPYWIVGEAVRHPSFGLGKVVRVDGAGRNDRIVVQFGVEKKVLLPQLAKIEKA